MRSPESRIARLFKPYIVKRPNGGCSVRFPLSELDAIVRRVIREIHADRPSPVIRDPRRDPAVGDRLRDEHGNEHIIHPLPKSLTRDLAGWRRLMRNGEVLHVAEAGTRPRGGRIDWRDGAKKRH